ncbi:MAG: archaeosine biosynthesis radical SAM protein RaSEA [Candidatus Thermoplasmatota archaeon]|nr:archaeosine biosynthesis radical SAM protein RaSEA [Candidatus Thermoplasmatota archaeon]MDI6856177.1 archaeosine biosynthesis radical SAM protein RaSEA [Candidatus Thermoplasmatota archaeon]
MIADRIKMLRGANPKKSSTHYVRCFTERDVLDGKVVDTLVIILRTRGCKWALQSGCSMCGYINEAAQVDVSDENLLLQVEGAMRNYRNEKIVKIYTSGSFLDTDEISENAQTKILEFVSRAEKVVIESRPEFVNKEHLSKLIKKCNLEIALGLESSNPLILEKSINKGLKLEDYVRAAKIINELGIKLRTYILIKPPFITEEEAIVDAVNSAKFASKYSQTLSFNPVNIQKNTLVEYLWKRKEYRPPWLWSVLEVLKESKTEVKGWLICSPTGGGSARGAHNCGKCDSAILRATREFSLTQNTNVFDNLSCDCKQRWLDMLELEGFAQGPII